METSFSAITAPAKRQHAFVPVRTCCSAFASAARIAGLRRFMPRV